MQSALPRVLIVLTDQKMRALLASRFEKESFEVEATDSIMDAERKAVQFRPKVFLVEVEESGSIKKLVKHWRSLPTLHTAKLVIMFHSAERAHVDETLQSGADQVILLRTVSPKDIVKSALKLLSA